MGGFRGPPPRRRRPAHPVYHAGDVNGFDIALLALAAFGGLVGLLKGLTRLVIGLLALVAAFLLAAQLHAALAERLTFLSLSPRGLKLTAYLAIFLGTLLVGVLVAWLVRALLKAAQLGWADRLAGAALGVAGAVLAAALLVLPLLAYSAGGESLLSDSRLASYVTAVADLAKLAAPRELAQGYEQRIAALRQRWLAGGQG